jgi:hypothetical protein
MPRPSLFLRDTDAALEFHSPTSPPSPSRIRPTHFFRVPSPNENPRRQLHQAELDFFNPPFPQGIPYHSSWQSPPTRLSPIHGGGGAGGHQWALRAEEQRKAHKNSNKKPKRPHSASHHRSAFPKPQKRFFSTPPSQMALQRQGSAPVFTDVNRRVHATLGRPATAYARVRMRRTSSETQAVEKAMGKLKKQKKKRFAVESMQKSGQFRSHDVGLAVQVIEALNSKIEQHETDEQTNEFFYQLMRISAGIGVCLNASEGEMKDALEKIRGRVDAVTEDVEKKRCFLFFGVFVEFLGIQKQWKCCCGGWMM